MKPVVLFLAAALAAGLGAVPAAAQTNGGGSTIFANPNASSTARISLQNELLLDAIRSHDPRGFERKAREIFNAPRWTGRKIKNIGEWTEAEFQEFIRSYEHDLQFSNLFIYGFDGFATGFFFEKLIEDSGGGDD